MVVQYREADENKRKEMTDRLARIVREEVGINCIIELVSAHTLPRTSSGKLSRAGTQRDYLRRQQEKRQQTVEPLFEEQNSSVETPALRLAAAGKRYAH
jgi:fatty-acyl-CoA synthase